VGQDGDPFNGYAGCVEMHVVTGTPYGVLNRVIPFDYEYVVLLQGTNVIYCPNPHLGNYQFRLCAN
jgi:hypothetical protein